jgi:hypothetical protein
LEALQFAHAFDAACDVIHVAANSDSQEKQRIVEDRLTCAERKGLDSVKNKLDGGGQRILATGDLASVIAATSVGLKSDLLVMGRSRSRDEIAHVYSLPFTLARLAACPVVVIQSRICERSSVAPQVLALRTSVHRSSDGKCADRAVLSLNRSRNFLRMRTTVPPSSNPTSSISACMSRIPRPCVSNRLSCFVGSGTA